MPIGLTRGGSMKASYLFSKSSSDAAPARASWQVPCFQIMGKGMPYARPRRAANPTALVWWLSGIGHEVTRKETFMDLNKRLLTRILVLMALAMGLMAAVPALASTAYVEGVVMSGPEPECVLVRDSQGN